MEHKRNIKMSNLYMPILKGHPDSTIILIANKYLLDMNAEFYILTSIPWGVLLSRIVEWQQA